MNLHYSYQLIEKITQKTVWSAIIMLFFSSLFPYTTKLISADFGNPTVQSLYGILVLLITFSVLYYYRTIVEANHGNEENIANEHYRINWIKYDIVIKLIGLMLSFTIFPPAASFSVMITLCFIVIPNQFK